MVRGSSAGWIAAGVVVAVPLAMDPGGYFIFLPLKWTLATALVAAGLAALILRGRALARGAATGAWALLFTVVVGATVFGTGGLTSWIGYPGRYLGVIAWATFFGAFVFGASLIEPAERGRVVRAAALASVAVSAYALLQEIDLDPIEWEENLDLSRTRSTLGNAAFLGAYLAMMVPLAGRLALDPVESRRGRMLFATAAGLGGFALLTTETRGAWLGALAGVVVVLALEHRRLRALPRRTARTIGVAVLVAVVALATVSPYASRVRSITDPSEATGHGRLVQWERTVDLIAERPALGWGPETYAFRFPRSIDAEFERDVGRVVIPDRAHNVILDLAATTGLVGVLAFTAVIALAAVEVARRRERDPLTVGLAGACAAYIGQLQFNFSVPDLDVIFWLFAGLAVAASVPRTVVVTRAWAAVPVLAALLVVVWGGSEVVADRTLRDALEAEADGDFVRAQRLVDRAADRAPLRAQYLQGAARLHGRVAEITRRRSDFERSLDALEDARDLVPADLELATDRGDLLLAWGELAADRGLIGQAARQYADILEHDPSSSRVHLTLGVAYVQLGRADDAEQEWQIAAALSPDSPGPLLNLGRLYLQQGHEAEARRALRAALEVDPENVTAQQLLEELDS